jgi:hypothetical protein
MRLIRLIVPAVLIAVLAVFAPHADAQTMGEYASTTAGVGTAGGSMGTSNGSSDIGGGSSTWGASGLGGSWSERAGAASASGMGADFESRAGSATSGSTGGSRWPESSLGAADTSSRFSGSSSRFPDQNRFTDRSELSSSDRFPGTSLNDNRMGLDTSYNAINNF